MRRRISPHRAQQLVERAAAMRSAPTSSEALLLEALRGGRLGVSVRRQVPLLGKYIADLYVPALKLVIEIDGAYHADRRRSDERRDRALQRAGFRVLRVDAALVMNDLAAAVSRVRAEIER